jgi:hypothetical protein
VQQVVAAAHVEWVIPNLEDACQWRSGLILSSNWKEGICGHATSTIAKYMQTRALSGRRLASDNGKNQVDPL